MPRRVDRLSLFAFLWGAATLSHHLASPRWFVHHASLNVALVATAILVVLRPHAIVLFTALAALGFVNVVKLAPEHPNHVLFEGVGDLVIVSAVLLAVREARRRGDGAGLSPAERQQLFERMAAPIRVGALESRRLLWNVWALFAVGIYGAWAWRHRRAFAIAGVFRIRPAVLWVFPLLLLFNGASPYLGLKTHASFSMFSNLRTEDGRTNHVFLGRLSLATWQDDLVDIVGTDLPALAKMRDADLRLTYFHFRRLAGTARRDFGVTYRRNGELRVLRVRDGIASDPEAATPPPWWMHKLLRFRGVDRDGRTRCWN